MTKDIFKPIFDSDFADLDNIILLYKQESLHDTLYQKPEIDNKAASR